MLGHVSALKYGLATLAEAASAFATGSLQCCWSFGTCTIAVYLRKGLEEKRCTTLYFLMIHREPCPRDDFDRDEEALAEHLCIHDETDDVRTSWVLAAASTTTESNGLNDPILGEAFG
jgi:hypothetical protein